MEKFKKIAAYVLPVAVLLSLVLSSMPVHAQYNNNQQNPDITLPPGEPITLTNVSDFIKAIVKFIIGISITLAVGFIAYGGIKYIISAGDEKAATAAKAIVLNGIIGIAIVLAIGVIINTVSSFILNRSIIVPGS